MAPTGTVFEIKRFAVHDGPGVRTVIFLKGCPLRCRWCHNPEGMEPKPQLAYFGHKCLHCGECVKACPNGAHALVDGMHVFTRDACVACGECETACPGRALRLFGHEFTVAEACQAVLSDRDFYRDGGGVTISGGEPLLQVDFCIGVLKSLKQEGIHCAIDTSGAVPWDGFEQVLPYVDLFLYDIKHIDVCRHREQVGASNQLILANLKRLTGHGVRIEIRIPIIPGFNDDTASIAAIGAFLADLPHITGIRLLPYHPAHSKHTAVGRDNLLPETMEPTPEAMDAIAKHMQRFHSLIR